jgi:hypothetical protein
LDDIAARLRAIVERVRHNVPHRRDPECFHVEKSCLAQIADELELGAVNHVPVTRTRPPSPLSSSVAGGSINHDRALPYRAYRSDTRLGRGTITTETIAGRRVIVQRARMPFAIYVGSRDG